jgi:hypothetical protein
VDFYGEIGFRILLVLFIFPSFYVLYLIWSLHSCSGSAETLLGQFLVCAQCGLGSRWGTGIDFSLLFIFLAESLPP